MTGLDDYDFVPVTDLGDPMKEQDTALGRVYIKMLCYMGWYRARAAAALTGEPLPTHKELVDEIAKLTGESTTGLEVTEKPLTTTGKPRRSSDEPDWDV